MKEIVPRLSRVAVLGTVTGASTALALKETERAAGALGVKFQYLEVGGSKDIETAFQAASKRRAGAVLVLESSVFVVQRPQIADLAVKNRLPAMYSRREFVEDGGLMAYLWNKLRRLVPSRRDLCRQDSQRRQPAELPVEQPRKFELLINLKTAKQIGLTIPPNTSPE